jgi:hypothetical protein
MPVEDVVEAEEIDLNVYCSASLLATPTKMGSSSSVLSSTSIVSISLPFPFVLPFPFSFSFSDPAAFFVVLGFVIEVERVAALRGIR